MSRSLKDRVLNLMRSRLEQFCRYPRLVASLETRFPADPPHILAIGKAAVQMAKVASAALSPRKPKNCIVLSKYGFKPSSADSAYPKKILEAGHPIPDDNSMKHSAFIMDYLKAIPAREELCVLLSGGSSALFEYPAAGQSLMTIRALNSLLLKSGLDISQINSKRKEYSALKGGKAAGLFEGKSMAVYLLSDVPGNDFATIGSGPFYLPQITNHFVIGDNQDFLKVTAQGFKREFPSLPIKVSPVFIQDDADAFARGLARFCAKSAPGIYIFGGECALKVKGTGKGGRLSHLALRFLREMCPKQNTWLCAFATDANDHLAESAGAFVDSALRRSIDSLAEIDEALNNFDSYTFLQKSGAIIPSYYSGCNVNDVIVLHIGGELRTVGISS